MNDRNKELFYQFTKEILKNNDGVEIDYDDSKLTISFKISKEDQDKIDKALKEDDFDFKSMVKAPSTGKWYAEALSKPDSEKYWNIDEIAHLPENANDKSLQNFLSTEPCNRLKLDKDGFLTCGEPSKMYTKILTQADGKFEKNTWTFYHKLPNGCDYYFLFDINKLIDDVRPFQINFASIPFKLPTLKQTFQITGIDGSVKGWISISLDTKDGIIVITSNVLSATDEISIFVLDDPWFQLWKQVKENGW